MGGRSSRPRHRKVLYFPHRRLWTMEYSCKVWCKPCRRRLIPRQHSRLSWRLRQELGVNALTPRSRCASNDLVVHSWNGQRPPPSSSEQNSKLFCPSI
ncbi:hypothetical protein Taro_042749 [Colocasia esculenta]|uniref:Uncharacterized protein n=1 Tax=Colocasia esculenta TaxID=4460 RepID=A0A843WTP8_COLES|nr:hypothetical protein [Colocasia esculenta]